jgi:hypothetical protein
VSTKHLSETCSTAQKDERANPNEHHPKSSGGRVLAHPAAALFQESTNVQRSVNFSSRCVDPRHQSCGESRQKLFWCRNRFSFWKDRVKVPTVRCVVCRIRQRMGRRGMTHIRLKFVHEYLDRHGKLRRYYRGPALSALRFPAYQDPKNLTWLISSHWPVSRSV